MAAKHSRHVALTAPLVEHIEAQVAQGKYASISEMVRVALRLLKERDDAMTLQNLTVPSVERRTGRIRGRN